MAKAFCHCAKVTKFRQIWSHCKWERESVIVGCELERWCCGCCSQKILSMQSKEGFRKMREGMKERETKIKDSKTDWQKEILQSNNY